MVFSYVRLSNNRFVMFLDVWGCMCVIMGGLMCVYFVLIGVGNLLNFVCDGDWGLKLFFENEEFLVSVGY